MLCYLFNVHLSEQAPDVMLCYLMCTCLNKLLMLCYLFNVHLSEQAPDVMFALPTKATDELSASYTEEGEFQLPGYCTC